MHKAKGLEWDRVYLMAVNSYDFPSAQPYDQYIAEKWFLRQSRQVQTGGPLNLQAEALEQLKILAEARDPAGYIEKRADHPLEHRPPRPESSRSDPGAALRSAAGVLGA